MISFRQLTLLERCDLAFSDVDIKAFVSEGLLKIKPFDLGSLGPAGYDLRSATNYALRPLEAALISTLERVELSRSLLGVLHIRSSFAREGVFASLALVDPGFRGQLTILLFNSRRREIRIEKGERLVQITFFKLRREAEVGYQGRYQDSYGVVESARNISLEE